MGAPGGGGWGLGGRRQSRGSLGHCAGVSVVLKGTGDEATPDVVSVVNQTAQVQIPAPARRAVCLGFVLCVIMMRAKAGPEITGLS